MTQIKCTAGDCLGNTDLHLWINVCLFFLNYFFEALIGLSGNNGPIHWIIPGVYCQHLVSEEPIKKLVSIKTVDIVLYVGRFVDFIYLFTSLSMTNKIKFSILLCC